MPKNMEKEQNLQTAETQSLNIPVTMPRISHFIDENGNNVDINAGGVNVILKRDGTHEYFISYGFAGRMQLTPIYVTNKRCIELKRSDLQKDKNNLPIDMITLYDFKGSVMSRNEINMAEQIIFVDGEQIKELKN